MTTTSGTRMNYYHVCRRKLWLFAAGINMEHTSDLVADGKLTHELSYAQRAGQYQEVEIDGVKIDFYDAKNKVVHETKRSDTVEEAHRWQVKYYLLVLERQGIRGATAVLEYPRLRRTEKLRLEDEDRSYLQQAETDIAGLLAGACPARIRKGLCRNCSYYDFCWTDEE